MKRNHAFILNDRILALVLAVSIFLGGFLFCDTSHFWGDDYAAYMLQGKALADGTLARQLQENLLLHASTIYGYDLNKMTELVYVWGFPLQLAAMYKLIGFDALIPQHILYYKIPGCLALGIFAAVLFLFYRRRFRSDISLVMSLFMALSIFPHLDRIQTDIPFLCMTFLSFYMYETLWEQAGRKSMIVHGCLLGVCMWYTYLVRPNGITVVALIAAMHICRLARSPSIRYKIRVHCIPYVVFALLLAGFFLIFPYPTSGIRDIGLGSLAEGLRYNYALLAGWLYESTPFGPQLPRRLINFALKFCFCVGFLYKGRKREWGYAIYLLGTVLITAYLPYNQGLRYVFGVLPLILLFLAEGIAFLYHTACRLLKRERAIQILTACVTVGILLLSTVEISAEVFQLWNQRKEKATLSQNACENAYADPCLEAYRFIREETEEDAIFAFQKPRALYLNTGRMAFSPTVNGHNLLDADYYMRLKEPTRWQPEVSSENEASRMTLEFENTDIEIYRIQK